MSSTRIPEGNRLAYTKVLEVAIARPWPKSALQDASNGGVPLIVDQGAAYAFAEAAREHVDREREARERVESERKSRARVAQTLEAGKRTRRLSDTSLSPVIRAPAKRQKQNKPDHVSSLVQRSESDPNAKRVVKRGSVGVLKSKPNGYQAATQSDREPAHAGGLGPARVAHPKGLPANAITATTSVLSVAQAARATPAEMKPAGPATAPPGGPSSLARCGPVKRLVKSSSLNEAGDAYVDFLDASGHTAPTAGDRALQAEREARAQRPVVRIPGDDDSKLNASNKQYGYSFIHDDRGLMKRV
ncbi:hypothetical protein GGG16DRAFT_113763 [Schizophyllum commune]